MSNTTTVRGNLNIINTGIVSGNINTQPQLKLSGNIAMGSAGGGTTNYEKLTNKPSIESVVLVGNKDFPDLGLTAITADDLLEILV